MHRRVWTAATLLLLGLALVPRPAPAAFQAQVGKELRTPTGFAVLWYAARGMLSPQRIFGLLGPGMDPGGSTTPPPNGTLGTGVKPPRPPHPESDLGPGMDPLG